MPMSNNTSAEQIQITRETPVESDCQTKVYAEDFTTQESGYCKMPRTIPIEGDAESESGRGQNGSVGTRQSVRCCGGVSLNRWRSGSHKA